MKREGLPALPLGATKVKRHRSCRPRSQPFSDSRRLYRGTVDTCGATTKSRDGQGAAVTKEETERHARLVQFYEKTCNDTETRKMPCLASDSFVSPKECSAGGSRWLVRHLFVTLGLLLVTSTLAYCMPSASLRVIVATAAFALGPIGGALEGTSKIEGPHGASGDAEAVTQPDAIFQRGEGILSLQLNKEQRKAALLGLRKHQQMWPTFAHGKSKRGSIVVYRPLPTEAATEVYDPKSDLLIDAVLMDHLLQTIPPDTSFLLVIDLQHVADHIRASLAPKHLAALHKQSSLSQFVKSLHWQMIRMIFLRPLCEGVILINAPAIVLQVQPILEHLLFYQRPGSLREALSSDDRATVANQYRGSYFLQISEDEKALHAAVDASELPSEYAGKYTIPPRVRTSAAGECGSLSKDYLQSGSNFAEHGGHKMSFLYNLGDAPEHMALSQAISATLLELDTGEARLTTRASGPPSLTTATSGVRQQFRRQQSEHHHAVGSTRKKHNHMYAGRSISLVKEKGPDPLRFPVVTSQQKNSYAALLEHGARQILMEEPKRHTSVSKAKTQCDRATLPSDPFSTALRGAVPHAGSAPDVQQILCGAHSLRYNASTARSHVAKNFKPVHAPTRSVLLEAHGSGHRDRKHGETSTKSKTAPSAQGHLRRECAACRTEESRLQSSQRDQAHQGKKSARKRRTDVHTSNHTEHATSMQPQKPTAPSDGRSLAPCRGVSRTARARLIAPAARKTREAEKSMAPHTCWGKCERKAHADKPHQPNFTVQKQANQASSSSRKKATSVDLASDTSDGRRAAQRNTVVNSGASHESLEPDISDPERRSDGTDKSNFGETSFYGDDTEFISSNGGKISPPQSGPRFAGNTVRRGDRKQADNSDCGSQDNSEDSIQSSEATWTEETVDRFKGSHNISAGATRRTHRLSQKSRPEDEEEIEHTQNGTGGPTTSSPWTGYFWTETEAAGIDTFDDIS